MLAVSIDYLYAILRQIYFGHLTVVFNQVADLALEAFNDLVHAADRLKERWLIVKIFFTIEAPPPELGVEQILQLKPRPGLADIRNRGRVLAERVSLRAIGSWRTRLSRLMIAKNREQAELVFFVGSV